MSIRHAVREENTRTRGELRERMEFASSSRKKIVNNLIIVCELFVFSFLLFFGALREMLFACKGIKRKTATSSENFTRNCFYYALTTPRSGNYETSKSERQKAFRADPTRHFGGNLSGVCFSVFIKIRLRDGDVFCQLSCNLRVVAWVISLKGKSWFRVADSSSKKRLSTRFMNISTRYLGQGKSLHKHTMTDLIALKASGK